MLSLCSFDRRWLAVVAIGAPLVALGLMVGEGQAVAQPKTEAAPKPAKPLTEAQKKAQAKKAFEAGGKKFDAGDYPAALALFREADELIPGAVPKFRIAECMDKQNDITGAVKAYEDFLASNPDAAKKGMQERIDAARGRIDALKKTPAEVKVAVTPAGAQIFVDGAPQSGNPVKVAPGKHVLSAKADGYEESKQDIEVTFAEKKDATLTLTPKVAAVTPVDVPKVPSTPTPPVAPPPPSTEGGSSSTVPAIITLSLAGAGAVVGTVFGVLALGSKSDFEDTPTQELFDETERNALIADMSFGVAITFGVTGLVLLLSGGDEPEPAAAGKPQFAPWVGSRAGGGSVTVRF